LFLLGKGEDLRQSADQDDVGLATSPVTLTW
jgi:hypothetical protein